MSQYRYENNQFIIENYDNQKPFSSFLPGIAGLKGIPLWVYYTNRGQGIAGFGVENKNGSIFDFVPANVAYKRTELQGFRTFIKINDQVHEVFSSISDDVVERRMLIESNSLGFEEINKTLGVKVNVTYFTATEAPYAGLIRKLTLTNLEGTSKSLEVVDGLMTIWPYKNDDVIIKTMSNLAVAWFEAYNTDKNMPFFRNRSTTNDSAEVGAVEAGHFYAAFSSVNKGPLPVIFDPDILFGEQTSLIKPMAFMKKTLPELLAQDQVSANKLPCAFCAFDGDLNETLTITSVIGKMASVDQLNQLSADFSVDYFDQMAQKATDVTAALLNDVDGKTAYPLFDAYVKQSYLDNFLRGGYPLSFEGKEGPIVYHVYSRIHGDMEREYNDFYVEPAYYSHGNGNFRDVNQNRRNDVYFVQEAGLYNVKQFMELIQLDGQNPLVIKGSRLLVNQEDWPTILKAVKKGEGSLATVLKNSFTPGELLTTIEEQEIELDRSQDELLNLVMKHAVQENHAAYGHGFWVDHWTYNMDLVDNYLNIYPDRLEALLYEDQYKYFRSPDFVLPRNLKYVLNNEGNVRQYNALYKNSEQLELEGFDTDATNWYRLKDQTVLKTNLAVKLLVLIINKMTNFDPSGLGLMMNSDKPGWNDAMNGLPGLFGSGMSEVIEIRRVIEFLIKGLSTYERSHSVPKEVAELMADYQTLLEKRLAFEMDELCFWESVQTKKEAYLSAILNPIADARIECSNQSVLSLLKLMHQKSSEAISQGIEMGSGIMPSYLVHQATAFEINPGQLHPVNGMQTVRVKEWSCRSLPLYLEAPARYLKQLHNPQEAKDIFDKIKLSGMYDEQLKMYVTSESLEDETLEIGRARAFTPGWLERESVFMHMSYKYLLGLLKSGLHDAFYGEIEHALPPFMDPSVYGRSTLENSSFIASSRNPNPKNHGRGFVSRLTGTTSEMITMWLHMMTGSKLFTFKNQLNFELNPVLRADYFDERQQVSFNLFKNTKVIYDNPKRKNTFGQDRVKPVKYQLTFKNGQSITTENVTGDLAKSVRAGEIALIQVTLD